MTCLEVRLEYKRKKGKGVDECRGKRENYCENLLEINRAG